MADIPKSRVVLNGATVGLIYISLNPNRESEKVATIVPMDRTGKWLSGDRTVIFGKAVHDFFPVAMADEEIQRQMLRRADLDLAQVVIEPLPW